MAEIQAVFLDIDGTIVHDSKIVDSALTAVRLLRERKVHVGLCTGRSLMHAQKVQKQLAIDSCVYFNGGLAVHDGQVLVSHPLAPLVVDRIIDFATENLLPFILHTAKHTVIFEDIPDRLMPLLHEYDFPVLKQEEARTWRETSQDVYQVNVFMGKHWDQVVQNRIPECLIYRWNECAVDLQKRGCDKSMGALALLDAWSISPEHAVHIGDGGNDVGMFQMLGTSVAMGNAPDEVKMHAAWTTSNVEENGVFQALQRLGLI